MSLISHTSYYNACSQTVTLFVDELRRALSKDLQKKMCETYAFNVFDQWWDEREKKHLAKVRTISVF